VLLSACDGREERHGDPGWFPLVNVLELKERRATHHPSKSARLWRPSCSSSSLLSVLGCRAAVAGGGEEGGRQRSPSCLFSVLPHPFLPLKNPNKPKAAPAEQLGQQKCLEGGVAVGCGAGELERSISPLVGNGLKPLSFVFKETHGTGAWNFGRLLGP